MDISDHAAVVTGCPYCLFRFKRRNPPACTASPSAAFLRYQLGSLLLNSSAKLASRIHPFRRDEFPQCLLRHSSRIGFCNGCRPWDFAHSSTAMVCPVHMAWRARSTAVCLLAFHTVNVRYQCFMPMVPGPYVCNNSPVHVAYPCHGLYPAHPQPFIICRPGTAHILPAEY